MNNNSNDYLDGSKYEFFIRRAFNCERSARRYPYADSDAWMALVYRWQSANSGEIRDAKIKIERTKEYEKYFKTVIGYFEKTIDYVIKKHSSKVGKRELADQFSHLREELSSASNIEHLKIIIEKGTEIFDRFNVVLS